MTRLPAPGCGLRAYPGPGARPCPAVRVGRLHGDPATMSTCSAERAALLPGCGLRPYPGYAVLPQRTYLLAVVPRRTDHDVTKIHGGLRTPGVARPAERVRAGWLAAARSGCHPRISTPLCPSGRPWTRSTSPSVFPVRRGRIARYASDSYQLRASSMEGNSMMTRSPDQEPSSG